MLFPLKIFPTSPNFFISHQVILYGSRAKGNYKDGSDIDITLIGKNLKLKTVYETQEALEELNLPYIFDISIFTILCISAAPQFASTNPLFTANLKASLLP
jgi:hypothetical protein